MAFSARLKLATLLYDIFIFVVTMNWVPSLSYTLSPIQFDIGQIISSLLIWYKTGSQKGVYRSFSIIWEAAMIS